MGWLDSVELIDNSANLSDGQKSLINLLYDMKVLKIGEFKLKSDRRSPTFLNFGDVNDGVNSTKLGDAFATAIMEHFGDKDITTIIGPAYKGIPLAVSAAEAMGRKGRKVHYTYDRKEEKGYGEATGAGVSKADMAKKIFSGHVPKDGDKCLYIDDVTTTGKTKIEEHQKVMSVAAIEALGLVVAANRQELDDDGEDAMINVGKALNAPVKSLLTVNTEVVPYLRQQEKVDDQALRNLKAYIRTYGIESTKPWCRSLRFIQRDRGIIPACDVPLETFEELVKATADITQVVAYKIPATSGRKGWESWIATARKHTDKPLIYDHQKAGTDIPDTGEAFMRDLAEAGFDAAILFPQSGPQTEFEWIHSAFQNDMEVIVGGEMTHKRYKASEGGYINDDALVRMYLLGAKAGVNNFVVPGNKPERIKFYKEEIEKAVPGIASAFYSPGLVAQGGKISEATKVAGERWYGIVGRGIYGDPKKLGRFFTESEMREATFDHVSQLS